MGKTPARQLPVNPASTSLRNIGAGRSEFPTLLCENPVQLPEDFIDAKLVGKVQMALPFHSKARARHHREINITRRGHTFLQRNDRPIHHSQQRRAPRPLAPKASAVLPSLLHEIFETVIHASPSPRFHTDRIPVRL